MLTLKIGRQEYEITEKDLFIENLNCIQLVRENGRWLILPKSAVEKLFDYGVTAKNSERYEMCSEIRIEKK